MTRLIEQVKPEQFISYGTLKVAFYDAKNPNYNEKYHDEKSPEFVASFKGFPKYLTYIHILLGTDDRSVVQRAAGNVRVPDGNGATKILPEIEAYERAYKLYLKLKEIPEEKEVELERLRAEVEQLRAKKVVEAKTNDKKAKTGEKKAVAETVVEKLSEK